MPLDNEYHRFGSARFAEEDEVARAGLFRKTPRSILIGFLGQRPLYWNGQGGMLLTAGARGNKLVDVISYAVCQGIYDGTLVCLDMKGECSKISQILTRKFGIYWNPAHLHGMKCDRINPVDYIRADSPSLVSDVKVFCENMIPLTGAPGADYFEKRARQFLEGIILTLTKLDGVLTLPRLYDILNLIPGGGDAWLDFAFEMSEAGFEISKSVEEEIAAARGQDSGGFRGILGEIFKAFAALSDPVLRASVSPPFTFSLADLCRRDRTHHLYLMPPAEFIEAWGPVIKAFFVGAMIYKARDPQAPMQTWVLDECAQLSKFPAITKLFTYGAGIGIRPLAVYQSRDQMRATGPGAETIIPSSAACRIHFAIRDLPSATDLSRQLGAQTLDYDDTAKQAEARHAREAALQALLQGGDPMEAGLAISHHGAMAAHRSQQHRLLRTPDEILNTPSDKAYIFADGLPHPIYADRKAYWEQRFMAGRFLPNPYHSPLDRVRVKTRFGHAWRSVIRAPVPPELAHLPQYDDGYWSYVEGYRP